MKALIFSLALAVPLLARADDGNLLAGRYSACVEGMTHQDGTPSSKKYVFTFGKDSSLDIVVSFHLGTAKCDNDPGVGVYEYKAFQVIDDSGNNPGRFITAQDLRTNLYFKFVIAKSYAAIYSSPRYPVQSEIVDTMILDREQ